MRINRISRENGKTEVISIEQAVEGLKCYYSMPVNQIRAILESGSHPAYKLVYLQAGGVKFEPWSGIVRLLEVTIVL